MMASSTISFNSNHHSDDQFVLIAKNIQDSSLRDVPNYGNSSNTNNMISNSVHNHHNVHVSNLSSNMNNNKPSQQVSSRPSTTNSNTQQQMMISPTMNSGKSRPNRSKHSNLRDHRSKLRRTQQQQQLNSINQLKELVSIDLFFSGYFDPDNGPDNQIDKKLNQFDDFYISRTVFPSIFCQSCETVMPLSQIPSHLISHYCHALNMYENDFCRHCCRSFDTNEELRNHKSAAKQDTDLYQCNICSLKFNDSLAYVKHMAFNHDLCSFPYRCPQCGFRSMGRKSFVTHVEKCHFLILCPFCLQPTDLHFNAFRDSSNRDPERVKRNLKLSINDLMIHLVQHLNMADKFACHRCQCCFLSQVDLDDHQHNHELQKLPKKPWRQMDFSDEYPMNHLPSHQSRVFFSLPIQKTSSRHSSKLHNNKTHSLMDRRRTRNSISACSKDPESVQLYSLADQLKTQPDLKLPLIIDAVDRRSLSNKKPTNEPLCDFLNNNSLCLLLYIRYLARKNNFFFNSSKIYIANHHESIMQQDENDHCNPFEVMNLLKNYKCSSCFSSIQDLNEHYTAKTIYCSDYCPFNTNCYRALYLHVKSVYEKPHSKIFDSIVFSKYSDPKCIEDLDRTKVTPKHIEQAREFDENYSLEREVEEITSEFPNDPCPFYINVCMQCATVFRNFKHAALHCIQVGLQRPNQNFKLGQVMNSPQTHVIYHRSLIRVFRFINEEVREQILKNKIQAYTDLLEPNRNFKKQKITDGEDDFDNNVPGPSKRPKNQNTNSPTKKIYIPRDESDESLSPSSHDSAPELNSVDQNENSNETKKRSRKWQQKDENDKHKRKRSLSTSSSSSSKSRGKPRRNSTKKN
ncbi:hypothetical protein HUG17_8423 [Dermatophagoides farinae]|uniref:C2H2-type domain-containing protein n=2 Tax=Dermatophagoides farinae TaxID=6954 RepID=A0A9D4NZM9_DERFA|nr:hypothetical protein HUG17_8423 [Dermatophagoides farinae]